jgi:uncharacterized membrane protein
MMSAGPHSGRDPLQTLSKHRIESLTDGVYAVALTLLVLELKVPDSPLATTDTELQAQLIAITPKLASWLISFVFLILFWNGYHNMFHRLRAIDGRVLFLNFLHLALVSLAPFVVATYGAHIFVFTAQLLYNSMLSGFAVIQIVTMEYIRRHLELVNDPISRGRMVGLRIRLGSLVFCSVASIAVATIDPTWFGIPFMWMFFAGWFSGAVERRIDRSGP